MKNIYIDDSIKNVLPDTRLGLIECNCHTEISGFELRKAMEEAAKEWENYSFEELREHPVLGDIRQAYKDLGADPNRYRPASDSLLRRIVKNKDLYFVNNMVDLINLVVIKTTYSIGGFDKDLIRGDITLLKAPEGIPYQGIGRGELNITSLPVLKDEQGYFGTPTSDSIRTSIQLHTQNILLVFYDFYQNEALEESLALAAELLRKYISAREIQSKIIR